MKTLRMALGLGVMSLLPTLTAETTKPFFTPFLIDITPANCPAATSHIVGSGTGVNVLRSTVSADGSVHIGISSNAFGKGVDENGVVWTLTDGDNNLSFNGFLVSGASEFTVTENFQLLSHGKTTNIVVHQVVKVKVAADGSTTLEFEKEHAEGEGCHLGLI
jgi:hypothetical protein